MTRCLYTSVTAAVLLYFTPEDPVVFYHTDVDDPQTSPSDRGRN